MTLEVPISIGGTAVIPDPVPGPQGPTGDTGPPGLQGLTGAQGNIGLTGDTGPSGNTGLTGPQGLQGNTGLTGAAGPRGNTGLTGAIGPTGNTGPAGLQGATGNTGPAGPGLIKDSSYHWKPRDFNSLAVPQSSVPSAAVMTATADAINAMGAAGVIQEYEVGTYYVDQTISPNGGLTDNVNTSRQVYFNATTIEAAGSVPVTNFEECRDQATGVNGLAGLDDPGDNLPIGETTRVLFDVTNSQASCYNGALVLDGGLLALAAIAATNRHGQDGPGGNGSTWDSVHIQRCRWGLFGTPLYGQARNFYPAPFVGNIFKHLKIEKTVNMPILAGGNTIDDAFIGRLEIANMAGARSYLFITALVCGTIYTNGRGAADFAFDVMKAHLIFGSFYAELAFSAPIYARQGSWIEGTCKYGAGSTTIFTKKALIYSDDISGGGDITLSERCAYSADMTQAVLIKAKANSKRNYWVRAPFAEATKLPFGVEAGTGTLSTADKLVSFFQDGLAKWTPAGNSAAPTLTRSQVI